MPCAGAVRHGVHPKRLLRLQLHSESASPPAAPILHRRVTRHSAVLKYSACLLAFSRGSVCCHPWQCGVGRGVARCCADIRKILPQTNASSFLQYLLHFWTDSPTVQRALWAQTNFCSTSHGKLRAVYHAVTSAVSGTTVSRRRVEKRHTGGNATSGTTGGTHTADLYGRTRQGRRW